MRRRTFVSTAAATVAIMAGCTSKATEGSSEGSNDFHGVPSCESVDSPVFKVKRAKIESGTSGATIKGVIEHVGYDSQEVTINADFLDESGENVGYDRIRGMVHPGETLPFSISYTGKGWPRATNFELSISPTACY